MEDIQGSGGGWFGFMTTNAMSFGPHLLVSAKLSASHCPKIAMAWHPWATRNGDGGYSPKHRLLKEIAGPSNASCIKSNSVLHYVKKI
jgi:hypothetical protein